jgi:hypothetical protein
MMQEVAAKLRRFFCGDCPIHEIGRQSSHQVCVLYVRTSSAHKGDSVRMCADMQIIRVPKTQK